MNWEGMRVNESLRIAGAHIQSESYPVERDCEDLHTDYKEFAAACGNGFD